MSVNSFQNTYYVIHNLVFTTEQDILSYNKIYINNLYTTITSKLQ